MESNLERIKFKLEANTYVMSCYLTKDDLYSDMKNDIALLAEELEKCYAEIADKKAIIAHSDILIDKYIGHKS